MRVYHQRMRDGERVAWVCGGGRLRRIDRGRVAPACQALLDVMGPVIGWRLCEEWAASLPAEWDRTEAEIRAWAAERA